MNHKKYWRIVAILHKFGLYAIFRGKLFDKNKSTLIRIRIFDKIFLFHVMSVSTLLVSVSRALIVLLPPAPGNVTVIADAADSSRVML